MFNFEEFYKIGQKINHTCVDKMEKSLNFFVITKENFGLWLSLLVVGCFAYVNFYFSQFGLDVTPYVSPGEIISLTLISLGKLNTPKIIVILIVALSLLILAGLIKSLLLRRIISYDYNIAAYVLFFYNTLMIGMTLRAAVDPLNPLEYFFAIKYEYPSGGLGVFLWLLVAIGLVKFLNKFEAPKWIEYNLSRWELFFLLLLINSLIFKARDERESIVDEYKYTGTKVVTDSNTFISDSLVTYIGRTQAAIFLFDRRNKTVTVLPSSEVKRIDIKSTE